MASAKSNPSSKGSGVIGMTTRPRLISKVAALVVLILGLSAPATSALTTGVPFSEKTASYVVRLKRGVSEKQRDAAMTAAGARITGVIEALRLLRVELQPSRFTLLRDAPGIEWVHREGRVHIAQKGVKAASKTNDPLLWRQWALKAMRVFKAWKKQEGKANPVVVAVVDTGVDPSHPDLKDRVISGYDFVNLDSRGADDHGHGTHVAGIIAATPNNRTGIAGMSWGAEIMPLKALGENGSGGNFGVTASIVYAIEHGAKVVNLSLGGQGVRCPREFELAARWAAQRDVLLVAAAGNSARAGNPVGYPAACDGYVGVGATEKDDAWASFSDYGDYVDLSAPGVDVVSTIPPGMGMQYDPNTYGYGPASGTSMAAPHAAGLAALLLAQHPDWGPQQVQERMEKTALDLGPKGRDHWFGAGRIDAAAALKVGKRR